MRAAIILREDGGIIDLELPDEGSLLAELQAQVKGNIQVLDVDEDISMFMNEEGKYTPGLEHNPIGTVLLSWMGGMDGDYIMGPLVFTGTPDSEGETRGLTDEARQRLFLYLSKAKAVAKA